VFDFIDLEHRAATVKPGEYNLVNSYPRKVGWVCWDAPARLCVDALCGRCA